MENRRDKRKIGIVIAIVVLCVIAALGCGNKSERESVERYVQFTDNTTGQSYKIGYLAPTQTVQIPYDGLEHTFTYVVVSKAEHTPLGENGVFQNDSSGHVVKEPGTYSFEVMTENHHDERKITMVLVIEEPEKPEEPEEPEPEEPEPEQPQPKELPMGTHSISIHGSEPLYYSLDTAVPQALNLTLADAQGIIVTLYDGDRIIGNLSKNTTNGFVIDGTVLIRIENHSGRANSFTLKAEWAPELKVNERYYVKQFSSAYFRFVPTWNTTYSLEVRSGQFADVQIYDADFNERMHYNTNSPITFELTGDETYFIKIDNNGLFVTHMEATIGLLTETLPLSQREIKQTARKHIYLSTAVSCEGYYILEGNGLDITVYDTDLQPISQPQDGGARVYLEEGKRYYIQTEGDAGTYTFTASIESTTQLSGNLNDKGNAFIEFRPKISAQYEVTGVETYVWYTENLWQTSTVQAGRLYYARIEGTPNAAYSVAFEPIAPRLYAGRLYGVGANRLYKLDIGANAHIRTYCTSGVSSEFRICDETLNEVQRGTADNAPQYLDLPQGTYYLYVNISGDTSVMFELIDDSVGSKLSCGRPISITLRGTTPVYYTFTCTKTSTYWLRLGTYDPVDTYRLTVVETNSSQVVSVLAEAIQEDVTFGDKRAAFSMELIAGKTYRISLSYDDTEPLHVNLVFGIPARLQQLHLGDIPLCLSPSSQPEVNVVMGKSYDFIWAHNQDASFMDFDWEIVGNTNPNNILTKNGDTLHVGFDPTLYNHKASISFKDDFTTYNFVLVLQYPVKAMLDLSNDYYMTTYLLDQTGALSYDDYSVVKTELYVGNEKYGELENGQGSVISYPIFESAMMYGKVTISTMGKTYVYTTAPVLYTVSKSSLKTFNDLAIKGKQRFVIDARNDAIAVNKSIDIPASVTHLFIVGDVSRVYQGVTFNLQGGQWLYVQDFRAQDSTIKVLTDLVDFISVGIVSFTET
ncbi:MAG: hypothetical protein HFE47_07820 [Clostridia bacterium]|nr:hypothetical protein [Clostridia bacterium]